jgi:cytochrome c oxidase cbb3-type subunit 4
VTGHSTYETLRHLADSWGLVAMLVTFLALVAWPLRTAARKHNEEAAQVIFKDDDDGEL